jgi:hypothetical protein
MAQIERAIVLARAIATSMRGLRRSILSDVSAFETA